MGKSNYYQMNRDVLLNNKYKSLSEDKKEIKREYNRNRYRNMNDEEK